MWLEVGNLSTKLLRAERPEERDWLTEYLSFEDKNARFRTRGREVKREVLFNAYNSTFPAGFTSMVEKAAREEGFNVQVIDNRPPPVAIDPNADLEWLRDYQRPAVEIIGKRRRGILWLPTGSGKTEIIVGLTRALPCKWLALVHRSQLADDIGARYEKRSPGLVAGRVLEGRWDVPEDATLVCATFQSLQASLKKGLGDPANPHYVRAKLLLEDAQGIIVDECHTIPADSFYRTAMMTRNAYYRVGLSGTPLARGDRRSLFAIAALGPVVYRVKTELLVQRGVLARPTVRLATVLQESKRTQWSSVYTELITTSRTRNAAIVALVKRATLPGFVFVEHTAHGKALAKMLLQGGVKAEFVWGKHSIDARKSIIRRLVAGHFDVIVCSRVFNEGIDVPELRSVVIASGGKSIIATLQRLGRGMRVERRTDGSVVEGGDQFEVYDVLDKGNKWLERHARERLNAYTADGFATFIEPPTVSSMVNGPLHTGAR